ncbi:MAG TPA: ModE family transcriptional regulator [Sphingobium sp.]
MTAQKDALSIKTRLYCGPEIAMGPGKASLLEAIAAEGSISAAGRALGMSYRRTWMLVDTMNRCWTTPLVETAAGGTQGGGARITDLGRQVLDQYRALEQRLIAAAQDEQWEVLKASMLTQPKQSQKG